MSHPTYRFWKWTKPNPIIKSARRQRILQVEEEKKEKKKVKEPVYNSPSDKRALCNERIANRYMIIQTPVNPFISTENYIDDLDVQDRFLRPKDSNIKEAE